MLNNLNSLKLSIATFEQKTLEEQHLDAGDLHMDEHEGENNGIWSMFV